MVESPTRWSDGWEKERVAKALYVESEMFARGDGHWQPWAEIGQPRRAHWYRMAETAMRAMNEFRMDKATEEDESAPRQERNWVLGGERVDHLSPDVRAALIDYLGDDAPPVRVRLEQEVGKPDAR